MGVGSRGRPPIFTVGGGTAPNNVGAKRVQNRETQMTKLCQQDKFQTSSTGIAFVADVSCIHSNYVDKCSIIVMAVHFNITGEHTLERKKPFNFQVSTGIAFVADVSIMFLW